MWMLCMRSINSLMSFDDFIFDFEIQFTGGSPGFTRM